MREEERQTCASLRSLMGIPIVDVILADLCIALFSGVFLVEIREIGGRGCVWRVCDAMRLVGGFANVMLSLGLATRQQLQNATVPVPGLSASHVFSLVKGGDRGMQTRVPHIPAKPHSGFGVCGV